jgi:hypothetical protein
MGSNPRGATHKVYARCWVLEPAGRVPLGDWGRGTDGRRVEMQVPEMRERLLRRNNWGE